MRKATVNFIMCVCLSVRPSVRMEQLVSHLTYCSTIWYFVDLWKICRENWSLIQIWQDQRYFTWRPIHILIISCFILLTMRNVSDQVCRQNTTHIFCLINVFQKSCRLWNHVKNMVQPDRPRKTIWCMRLACWMTKATKTRPEYIILIAFPLQQWVHERAWMLRYTYIACLVDTGYSHTISN